MVTLGERRARPRTLHIPLSVITSTDGQGVLDGLLNAGIRLEHVPADGFRVVDGQMPLIEGRVLNGRQLAALEI